MVELTYGLELEWADVDRHADLPCGSWSNQDYTIVNSDGHANDPTGKTWRWGGEINTDPTGTIREQVEQVRRLETLLGPTINYRCNLHVHIGFGEVTLKLAKALLAYIGDWQASIYPLVEPIPRPTTEQYPDPDAYAGAMRRYRRRKVSHQCVLPAKRVAEAMAATTLQEFYEAHAPLSGRGRAWHLAPRPGMNTRSLMKHGTLELRHFPGSAEPDEIREALRWANAFAFAFAANESPLAAYRAGAPWGFPRFRPYDHTLELGYQATRAG